MEEEDLLNKLVFEILGTRSKFHVKHVSTQFVSTYPMYYKQPPAQLNFFTFMSDELFSVDVNVYDFDNNKILCKKNIYKSFRFSKFAELPYRKKKCLGLQPNKYEAFGQI